MLQKVQAFSLVLRCSSFAAAMSGNANASLETWSVRTSCVQGSSGKFQLIETVITGQENTKKAYISLGDNDKSRPHQKLVDNVQRRPLGLYSNSAPMN